jgi:hypothetical protein
LNFWNEESPVGVEALATKKSSYFQTVRRISMLSLIRDPPS